MNHNLKALCLVAGTTTTLLLLGCSNEPVPNEIVRPVEVFITQEPVNRINRAFSGVVVGKVDTKLSFKVSGELTEFPVANGQRLAAGDFIGRLDETDYKIQVAQATATLAQAKAQALNASGEFNRTKQLWENDNVSESDMERAKAASDSAQAQLEVAGLQLALAEQKLSYCVLFAPRDGIVSKKWVEQNEVLKAGEVVLEFVSSDGVQFEVGVPESLISQIETGTRANVTIDAFPEVSFPATVVERSIAVGSSSTYPLKLDIVNARFPIVPGMAGAASIQFSAVEDQNAIQVPIEALAGRLEERYVWIVDTDELTVSKQAVISARIGTRVALISDGLNPGQTIVSRGVHYVEPGMKVRIHNSSSL